MPGICSSSFYWRPQLLGYQQPRVLCPCNVPVLKTSRTPEPTARGGYSSCNRHRLHQFWNLQCQLFSHLVWLFQIRTEIFSQKNKKKLKKSVCHWTGTRLLLCLFSSGHETPIHYFLLLLFTRKSKRALFGIWAYNQNLHWHQKDSLVSSCYLFLLIRREVRERGK